MQLLERHTQLAELEAARRDAGFRHGSVVLITGDAGGGKTALVQRFVAESAGDARVLWGMCDDLLLPRPLGPFRDMFPQFSGDLRDATHVAAKGRQAWTAGFFDWVIEELNRPPYPVVAVVEDAHWADEATLDAIRFLGRRISRMPALLIVTYRRDEVPMDHPLRLTFGAIPSADIRRVRIEPLSRDAVARLAGQADIEELYQLTGGNPFYVREVLAAPDAHVPLTVQDAVLNRVGKLSAAGHACAEITSVMPGRAERWVLESCDAASAVDEAVRLGVLRADGDAAWFPHELTRRAVEQSLVESRRREVNGRVLQALASGDVEPARLVHHGVQAADGAAVVKYAPMAARRAAALNCHREAASHFEHAIVNADHFLGEELADVLDAYGRECELTGVHEWAHEAALQAVELRKTLGDQLGMGRSLCRLSEMQWALGRGAEAKDSAERAVAVLETRPPGSDLVHAYAQLARLAMTDHQTDTAISCGERAIELAHRIGDPAVGIHAMVTVGAVRLLDDPDDAQPLIDALTEATERGDDYAVARAYANLAGAFLLHKRYDDARRYIDDGLVFCEAHDLVAPFDFLVATRASWNLDRGQWARAEQDARHVLTTATESAGALYALRVLMLIEARRGDPSAAATSDKAIQLAKEAAEAQTMIPVGLARAELAWLRGDMDEVAKTASATLELIHGRPSSGFVGEAALLLHRAGALERMPAGAVAPYTWQIEGRWREAARYWAEAGRPFEQADALSDAPGPDAQLEALEIFDRIGAAARAAMVRKTLAGMGVTSVPRGPRDTTRSSPAGLTSRQTEVLALLAQDLTYQQIADRLQLSRKTVDHHVTAVRFKLDVSSRDDAVLAGRRLGILTSEDGEKRRPR